ncbi:non-specific lipid-transfer protein-like protein [Tripterygium wilfordii]|uniref:Non-specific lipid-transfer protein-like protein n=1 Tax=Tripterygium wilfordii TaxID=458696 RepID=A0A7J7BZL1_TRIWF|nr:non-specific lipid transfer protein GPI-anchored 19-like [Tripterygium wilfordii]KAF5727057.1 non-specific lipid-transfer protein-like protein [Tripterygium wilfordii]
MSTLRQLTMITIAVAAVTFWAGVIEAQPSSTCTNVIISLAPCLDYITGNSSTPSLSCCTQLASVVRSQPGCLCEVLNGGSSSLGVTVNQTQALALPGACNVQTPPISRCNANSPTGSPGTTPSSTNGPASDGNYIKFTFSGLRLLLLTSLSVPVCLIT